ncbi:MAG: transporter [Cytophagales bacterium]|nr:MAG: transporter [Cytophagales bacterium]
MRHFFILLFFIFACVLGVQAQITEDSIFTFEEFYDLLINNHPVAKQARLLNENAEQELRMARGNFDPKLSADYTQKQYDKKTYYDILNSGLKIPFWWGDLKAGYKKAEGTFLSPENTLPETGLVYAGVSVPILQGVLIDERRATLQKAKIFQDIAEAEQRKEVNKLVLTAVKQYWEWYFAYQQYLLLTEGYLLADFRYRGVVSKVLVGDEAPIDSVEAKIILQTRDIELRQAAVQLQNTRLLLSNHLWATDETPLEIPENMKPQDFSEESHDALPAIEFFLDQASNNHPEVLKLRFKLQQLNVDERLYKNNFLPSLNIEYNLLNEALAGSNKEITTPQLQNYTFGLVASFPLFLRKERSKLQINKIKQNQTELDLLQTTREINNNIAISYNELQNIRNLIRLQAQMVENYTRLRDGEQQKFDNGESSLFLVNSREAKLIESQVKLEDLKQKYEKIRATLYYQAGMNEWQN